MSFVNEFIRLKGLSSRMVGGYRLITEQSSDNAMIDAVHTSSTRQSFEGLKQCIIDEVHNKIGSEKKMKKIISNSKKEQGSLSELLFSTSVAFPKQTILIRFGSAVEVGVRKYITSKCEDISNEVGPLIKKFLDRNIQMAAKSSVIDRNESDTGESGSVRTTGFPSSPPSRTFGSRGTAPMNGTPDS